jgi:hypothetical protein
LKAQVSEVQLGVRDERGLAESRRFLQDGHQMLFGGAKIALALLVVGEVAMGDGHATTVVVPRVEGEGLSIRPSS